MRQKPLEAHTRRQLDVRFDEVLTAAVPENKPESKTIAARPFVKWVGGKRSILPELIARMPEQYGTYHEPLLGGGALFFAVQPKSATLSDINFHLIVAFQAVRDDVDEVIRYLEIHEDRHNKEYYERARIRLFKETEPAKIAAMFIYLNKTCYNGLYRVNQSGKFNVPMGDYEDPTIVDEDNLRACSEALQGVAIEQKSFSQIKPQRGGFYYLDPPYHSTFNGYSGKGFGDEEHTKLAAFCDEIHKKGGYFMLSNSDTAFVRVLYKNYTMEDVSASRFVSCKPKQRGKENELIIRNYK